MSFLPFPVSHMKKCLVEEETSINSLVSHNQVLHFETKTAA